MSVDLSPEERAKIVAERADVKYGPFASLHEAYGVLAEELEEYEEAFSGDQYPDDDNNRTELRKHDTSMIAYLRENDAQSFSDQCLCIRRKVGERAEWVKRELAEAIDVIAVCDRIIAQWGEPS